MRDKAKQKARASAYYRANKEAIKARVAKWAADNPDKVNSYQKKWQEAHPGLSVFRARKWVALNPERSALTFYKLSLGKFGLTIEDFDNMFKAQNGTCAICKEACTRHKRLSVDHDHSTGKVRGLLCHRCNCAIGLLRDRSDLLETAAAYLLANK